jgi:hypothetical protein
MGSMGLFDPFNRERKKFLKDNKIINPKQLNKFLQYFYKISAQPNTKKKKKNYTGIYHNSKQACCENIVKIYYVFVDFLNGI